MKLIETINNLSQVKSDIKNAIENKGVTVNSGLTTYGDLIRNINYDYSLKNLIRLGKVKFAGSSEENTKIYDLLSECNTTNYTDMSYMFQSCSKLTSIPLIDTSNVTNMSYMFRYCSSLTTIPQLDTSKVEDFSYMFDQCNQLTDLPLLDASSVKRVDYFMESFDSKCKNFGGFKNLGMQEDLTGTDNYFLQGFKYMTRESAINIINNLYDRASAGMSTLTLKLNLFVIRELTSTEINNALQKGWIID